MEDRKEMDGGVSSWTSCSTGSGSESDFEFENAIIDVNVKVSKF